MQTLYFDFGRLKQRIKDVYGSQDNFADALGITLQSVSNKLNNRSRFNNDEMYEWMELLDIAPVFFADYFMTPKDKKGDD